MKVIPILAAITLAASAAQAQTTTLPFHAGQWGIEANTTGESGGILRFFTPRTALTLNLDGVRGDNKTEDNGTTTSGKNAGVEAALGLRRHAAIAPHVVGTVGGGALVSWGSSRYEQTGGVTKSSFHQVGPYVSLGGQYMIGDRFSAGVAYQLSAVWGTYKYKTPFGDSKQTMHSYGAAFQPLSVTLYF